MRFINLFHDLVFSIRPYGSQYSAEYRIINYINSFMLSFISMNLLHIYIQKYPYIL